MSDNGAAVEPQLVPLNAIFADDFVEILVPVMSNNTMAEVAEAVAHHVVGVRLRDRDARKLVIHNNRILPDDVTVVEAGIAPLDHIRVDWEE
jgi:toluene monooxygenase system protein B